MKHLILTLAMALILATPAIADECVHETCSAISSFAETVMTSRQNNVPMQAMMDITETKDELFRSIIVDAYSQPRWSAPENRRNAIHEFRDTWYLWCYKNILKQ